jgi:hypothetical protein
MPAWARGKPEMPIVAIVDGARLIMYANDHPPPHFHVLLAEHRGVIDIRMHKLIRGELPKAKLRAILEWAKPRRTRLLEAWDKTQALLIPERIQ